MTKRENFTLSHNSIFTIITILMFVLMLTACTGATVDRLKWVGKEPPMEAVNIPEAKSAPVLWPAARVQNVNVRNVNSLWSSSSKDFFKDKRARSVGDIMTVKIQIQDKAALDNKTERKRTSSESLGAPSVFGLQDKLVSLLPEKADATSLVSVSGDMDNAGEGVIERQEVVEMEVAAVVTQVLPNGNLFIYGSQEVRVNHEVRQVTVEGVIRPEDVTPSNTIDSQRIAEARISYGGKGIISDVQQPRIAHQILDILSPW